jgi:hypothetical protein
MDEKKLVAGMPDVEMQRRADEQERQRTHHNFVFKRIPTHKISTRTTRVAGETDNRYVHHKLAAASDGQGGSKKEDTGTTRLDE